MEYGDAEYWDERYKRETEPFEWYQDYNSMQKVLENNINSSSKVLVIGCGNSRLSERIYSELTEHVTSIDISPTVVKTMKEQCAKDAKNKMIFEVMDVMEMKFRDGQFDVVVGKGMIDTLVCTMKADVYCEKACKEIIRVLKPGGKSILVSFGVPDTRTDYLIQKSLKWKLQPIITLPKLVSGTSETGHKTKHSAKDGEGHYVYILTTDSK